MNESKAKAIYEEIKETSLNGLFEDLVKAAINYSLYRIQWRTWTLEQQKEKDPARTAAHNVFIDACNILSRNMAKNDESNEWRAELTDDRRVIGDFACYIANICAIEAR